MPQLESGQQDPEGGREKMEGEALRHEEVERLAVAAVDAAVEAERVAGQRRGFTITKFGRHEDGYFHARVTPSGGKPVYVHRRFGSWLAPGTLKGKPVLKEVAQAVKVELQVKARAIEKAERKAEGREDDDAGRDDGGHGSGGSDSRDDGDGETSVGDLR